MKRYIYCILIMLITIISTGTVIADTQYDEKGLDVSLGIQEPVEKVVITHYKDHDEVTKNGITVEKTNNDDSCYGFISNGFYKLPIKYTINPTNPQGLKSSWISSTISKSSKEWDNWTKKSLFGKYKTNKSAVYGVRDGTNVIAFGRLPYDEAIAQTTSWIMLYSKKTVEFDIDFNTYYKWGDATKNIGLMDLQNIATHEFGHGIGLNDVYSFSCYEVTMYGGAGNGETNKRSLEQPDKTGLNILYP